MAEFLMPSLGADMQEATLVQWRIRPGDPIRRGQVIGEVDTAKGVIDLECFQEGVVEKLVATEGQPVAVGSVMLVLGNGTGEIAARAQNAGAPSPKSPVSDVPPATRLASVGPQPGGDPRGPRPDVSGPAQAGVAPIPGAASTTASPRQKVSPLARRRAADLGVDLTLVSATGSGGAITVQDVERAATMKAATASRAGDPEVSRRALRSAIAAAMARSKREIPHYYLQAQIDMRLALDWLERENARRPIAARILPAVLLLKAIARALAEAPQLNGHWIDGELRQSNQVHAGFAVAMSGGGLVAPAIHDVNEKTLDQLMADLRDLVPRARTGRLRSSEMTDATITMTSLGELGVESVTGIIYPPQVALVGFGKILPRPWVESGELCIRPVVIATLSADHRATDGLTGAKFLAGLARILQEPLSP